MLITDRLLVWLAIGQRTSGAADRLQEKQFARTIGDGPWGFEEETIPQGKDT